MSKRRRTIKDSYKSGLISEEEACKAASHARELRKRTLGEDLVGTNEREARRTALKEENEKRNR